MPAAARISCGRPVGWAAEASLSASAACCRAGLWRDHEQGEVVAEGHGRVDGVGVHRPEPGDAYGVATGDEPMGNVAERVHLYRDPADSPGSCTQFAEHGRKLSGGIARVRPPRSVDASPPSQRGVQAQPDLAGHGTLSQRGRGRGRGGLDVLNTDRCHVAAPSPPQDWSGVVMRLGRRRRGCRRAESPRYYPLYSVKPRVIGPMEAWAACPITCSVHGTRSVNGRSWRISRSAGTPPCCSSRRRPYVQR